MGVVRKNFFSAIASTLRGFFAFGKRFGFSPLNIRDKLLNCSGYRNRKQNSEEPRKLITNNESKDNQKWWNSNNFFDNNWIYEVRLKLLDDNIESHDQKRQR